MADLEDFQDYAADLQRELNNLDAYADCDRQSVKRWVQKLDGSVSDGTIGVYLRNLRMTAQRLDQPVTALSEADMDEHVYELRHSYELSDGTIRNVEFAVRKFLNFVNVDGLDWVDAYELTPPPESRVRPEDMLTSDDIAALCEHANNLRDIALIELFADTGARLSLAATLRVKDVDLKGERPTYRPNPNAVQLKGAAIQDYPIIDARGAMRTWLRHIHPRRDDPAVAFFHKLPGHGNEINGDGSLSPTNIRNQIRKAADKAGIDKPVNPHNFRHSAITRMRREGYDRAEVEYRVHWEVDSDMWETYEHIAGEQHANAIFDQAGVGDGGDDGPERTRDSCPTCHETVAPHHQWCPRCGMAVSKEARDEQQRIIQALARGQVAVGDVDRRSLRADGIEHAGSHDDPSSSS